MLKRIFPKEYDFYTYFNRSASICYETAELFLTMSKLLVSGQTTAASEHQMVSNLEAIAAKITENESLADTCVSETLILLHKTFITPLERAHIQALCDGIDNITDIIDAAAQRIVCYKIKSLTSICDELAEVNLRSIELVKDVVGLLAEVKNGDKLLEICRKIHGLENDSDILLRKGLTRLFEEEEDIKKLLKEKEILELLEVITDNCEDVADIVINIVMEYS
jgi:uncharacterized protein